MTAALVPSPWPMSDHSMATMAAPPAASILTLPCELRNAIYMYIFEPDDAELDYTPAECLDSYLSAWKLRGIGNHYTSSLAPRPDHCSPTQRRLCLLQTCKQIHTEANLLALAHTRFHVSGASADPDIFHMRTAHLSRAQLGALRQLVLTARISQLRALNETWRGQPFGHAGLELGLLVVVPTRPTVRDTAYAEIADLSQSHTLAYVFCETLKGLRRVRCVEVRNRGCFTEVVFRLLYRSLVYRLWRWGGAHCGLRFESGECRPGGSAREENQWFRVYLQPGPEDEGSEAGEEVMRLVGSTGDMPARH